MANENVFQAQTIKDIYELLPGCEILKNDAGYRQGVLDITIFFGSKWAMLEFKKSKSARKRPNQDYYVDRFNKMSFAAFIYPENKEEVLIALQKALAPRRSARLSVA